MLLAYSLAGVVGAAGPRKYHYLVLLHWQFASRM
jgi:hypothetical protein